MRSITPLIEMKSVTKGGKRRQMPVPIKSIKRQNFLAIKWVIKSALKRREYGFANKLANEILRFLCNDNHKKWDDVKRIAQDVLTSRIKLWDDVLSVMLSSRNCGKLDKKISINL